MQTQQNAILDIILSSVQIDEYDLDDLANAIVERKNILITGSTASGKTTLLNCLLGHVQDDDLLVVEDYRELTKPSGDNTKFIATGEIAGIKESLAQSWSYSISRVVIGEIRTSTSAKLFVSTANGNSSGNISTIHGIDKSSVMERMELLCSLTPDPISADDVRKAVDIIVLVEKMEDGKRSISIINCED